MWFVLGCLVALAGVILFAARGSESRALRVGAWTVAVVLVLPMVAVIGFGVYLATPVSGDGVARERAKAEAVEIADELVVPHHNSNGVLDSEQLALYAVQHAADGLGAWEAEDREITVLGWSGNTAESGGATVDLRVDIHVAHQPGGLFGRDTSEGSAVRCWQLTVEYYEYDESAGVDEIDCPETSPDQAPVPAGVPTTTGEPAASPGPTRPWLLEDATTPANEERLLATLEELPAGADERAVREAVSDAFPDYTVNTGTNGGEVVAAVAGPTHRDCLVAVRAGADAPFRFTDFRRVQLELGELGCTPSLYWSNMAAH